MTLPPFPDRGEILRRLRIIFPEGTPDGDKCVRDASAAAVAAFLYIGAVADADRWMNPVHVVRMSDQRLSDPQADDREAYRLQPTARGERWYQENSREQIRDEVIRQGLVPNGAVVVRPDIGTTSSKPRYALTRAFADLFDPDLDDAAFRLRAEAWRTATLDPAALARIAVVSAGSARAEADVLVTFPSRDTRRLAPGPSSEIAKAVIEVFALRFLADPVVLWLSESAEKVAPRDQALVRRLRLDIAADRVLPDIILLDRGSAAASLRLVFVEVVASDGPVTEERARAFHRLASEAGFKPDHVACVTAFLDRNRPEAKKTLPVLAWDSVAWFASEPDSLLQLHREGPRLSALQSSRL
ncbi:MAG: hypothetical protein RLY86_3269 [Pseudomonadota bacterium]